jgi:hypothetical protein
VLAFGTKVRGWPATSWVHYATSCNTQSSAPEDGRDYRPKHVGLIGIIHKPLLLHLVGCLHYKHNQSSRWVGPNWKNIKLRLQKRSFGNVNTKNTTPRPRPRHQTHTGHDPVKRPATSRRATKENCGELNSKCRNVFLVYAGKQATCSNPAQNKWT